MSDIEKQCVLCGKSCAGQARIKNEKGQYAHQACVKAKQERETAPVEAAYDDDGMGDLLGDLEAMEETAPVAASACPSCGQRLGDGAMVCMGCGFDVKSGRALKTKKRDAKNKGGGSKAASVGVAAGGMALKPILPVLGALIGGAIGAGLWAFIAYQFNYEIGLLAIGVGVLCGLGAAIGAGGDGGALTGGMAALVAMGAIVMGKYAAVSMIVDDTFGSEYFSALTIEEIDEQMVMTSMADQICRDFIDAGEELEWPNPDIYAFSALWPDEYPQSIIDETWDLWEGLSFTEKSVKRREYGLEWDIPMRDVEDDWVMEDMAYSLCVERTGRGETIEWENPYLPLDITSWPDDYPQIVRTNAEDRWNSMAPDDQHTFRLGVLDEVNARRDIGGEFGQAIVSAGVEKSFMHPRQLLFMLLAVGAAYGIASNES